MPPEPLPFDRKDFFKERKPSSSEPVGVVPARWREPPTTPSSHHNNHGPFSARRWGGGGGSADFRRHFSGGKQVGGGWHITTTESGPHEDKYCKNDSSIEDNNNNGRAWMAISSQKDRKGGISWETTTSPNGNSHPLSDFVNSWDQLRSKDQHDKNNGGGVSNTGGQRLEKGNSLGSSIDWKPLKWNRTGSLSSRSSGFSHSSCSKSVGVVSLDTKTEVQPGNSTPSQSPSGDAAPCLTPRTLADEAISRKKARLGWGEGLAKFEKKKVGPDDIVDKEVGSKNGMVDGVSSSEPLLPSFANLRDKSPGLTGCSECASPATPYSFACSSSPGVEEKASIKAATVDNDICNPSVSSSHLPTLPQNNAEGSAFNLENLELTEVVDLRPSLNELLQSDDSSALCSSFVRSTAMDKLQVWKADVSRTLEITESEIDSLEIELKSLISDVGGSCHFPSASSSLPTECKNKNTEERSGDLHTEKADGSIEEHTEVEDLVRESPGTATSTFVESITLCNISAHCDAVEQSDSVVNLDITSENVEAKCSEDHVSDDVLGVVSACVDGSQALAGRSLSTVSVSGVHYGKEDKLYDLILASNKVLANRACEEFSKLVPTTQWCTNVARASNESLVKEKFAMRKRFLKFKERVVTLKFRVFHYLWKEDLNLLSIRRFSAKSHKKFESSSRLAYNENQKHRLSIRSRFSSPDGSLSLVPTTEIIDYTNKLLSDSRVRVYRDTLKMPSLILDKRERITSRFICNNGLVENPCDVEKERSVINPWTSEEKEIFLDKFSLFGKDFKKIASFLKHKTIADCVEFYYKNHKSDRFQKTKKNSEFAKQGKSYSNSTYLVTSGKRWNRETNAASLDMLGAVSAMAAGADGGMGRQRKCTSKFYIGSSSVHNERETAAADVLAGICGSISSEGLSSCITSSVSKRRLPTPELLQNDVDEVTCSDDSCEGETDSCYWTDEEKLSFVQAMASYGKDFAMISQCVRTRSRDQCKVFFSKARKCLGLDGVDPDVGSEGVTMGDDNQGGGGSDHEDTCMVDSGGSVVSHDKSSSECEVDVEDLHSPHSKEECSESDRNVVNLPREAVVGSENVVSDGCEAEVELVCGKNSNGNLEEVVAPRDMYSEGVAGDTNEQPSVSGAKIDADAIAISSEGINESEQQLPGDAIKVSGKPHFDKNVVSLPREAEVGSENVVSDGCEAEVELVCEKNSNGNLEDLEVSQDTYSEGVTGDMNEQPSVSGAKVDADTIAISSEGINESEQQLPGDAIKVSGLNSHQAEDISCASHFSRGGSLDLINNNFELNGAKNPCVVSQKHDNAFVTSNLLFPGDRNVIPHRKTFSQDDISPRLSFRKSGDMLSQRSSSTDGHHLHLPKRSLLDCAESSHILSGYPVTVSADKRMSYSDRRSKIKLDEGLLPEHCLPRDRSSISDEEKPSRSGDVKLFGQILTSKKHLEKPNFNLLKLDNHSASPNLDRSNNNASPNLDRSNNNHFGVDKNQNLALRSYGFWDGSRIQTGFPSLPDSAILLAKYPAAFGNPSTSFKLEQKQQLHAGFQSSNNGGGDYNNVYRRQEVVGACNGVVSDPVAAIRMHYAKTEQLKNGGNGGDIGGR